MLNKKDLKFITLLRQNSRETLTNISKKTKIPISTLYDKMQHYNNNFIKKYHNRMPVILEEKDYDEWLDPESDLDLLHNLLRPIDSNKLEAYELSTEINSVKNNRPELIKPAERISEKKKL